MASILSLTGFFDVPTSIGKMRCPIFLCDDISPSTISANGVPGETLEGSIFACWTGDSDREKEFSQCGDFYILGTNGQQYLVTTQQSTNPPRTYISAFNMNIPYNNRGDYISQNMLGFVTTDNETYKMIVCYTTYWFGQQYIAKFYTSKPEQTQLGYTVWEWLMNFTGAWTTYDNAAIQDVINNSSIVVDTTDPYAPGGSTGDDQTEGTGGTGNFDGTSDSVDFPSLPTLSAVDTGFITLFNPSISELQALANYMWSSGFDLDTFKKLFADPMDCILGLSIVPVNVPSGSSGTVNVGNISTGVTMTRASSQYVEIDCGTLNVNEFWGAYLDYDPYTKSEIYLPYIGTHTLATDDIMGKAVHVKYHIDVLSGALAAYVKCGDSVLYTFIGQCASSIPITGNDWTNVINGVLGIAGSVGSMIATGGASAPLAIPGLASTAVNALKPTVEKSGSMSGTGGMLGVQTPYLILTRPRQALPVNQNMFMGYPSFITRTFSTLSGYTEVESVHLLGMTATEQEISEIETLLKSGVIF